MCYSALYIAYAEVDSNPDRAKIIGINRNAYGIKPNSLSNSLFICSLLGVLATPQAERYTNVPTYTTTKIYHKGTEILSMKNSNS